MAQSRGAKQTDEVAEVMTEREIAKALGAEVERKQNTPVFDSEKLQNLESWEDLGTLFAESGVELDFADKVLGDGFTILSTDSKHELIGKPLALLEWRFNDGNMGEFVSIRAVVKPDEYSNTIRKVIINDGSTGIREQLKSFTAQTGKQGGLLVKRGLRVSEYKYEDDNGVQRDAKTYYLDASA